MEIDSSQPGIQLNNEDRAQHQFNIHDFSVINSNYESSCSVHYETLLYRFDSDNFVLNHVRVL